MILITGASGLMGCALIQELYAQGERSLRVLINRNNHLEKLLRDAPCPGLQIEFAHGSITDKPSLYHALQNVTQVYHLAGLISIVPGAYKALHEVNVTGVANLITMAKECGVQKIVHLSSIEALGYLPGETLLDESVGFRPDHTFMEYGKSKALGSTIALQLAKSHNLPLVVLTPGGIIGPYDYGLSRLGQVIHNAGRGKLPAYIDGGLDVVDSRDVAALCHTAMRCAEPYQSYLCSGTHVNLAEIVAYATALSGRKMPPKLPVSVAKMAATFFQWRYKLGGSEPLITHAALRITAADIRYDNRKAHAELNWQPRPLTQSIAETYAWFNQFYRTP